MNSYPPPLYPFFRTYQSTYLHYPKDANSGSQPSLYLFSGLLKYFIYSPLGQAYPLHLSKSFSSENFPKLLPISNNQQNPLFKLAFPLLFFSTYYSLPQLSDYMFFYPDLEIIKSQRHCFYSSLNCLSRRYTR